MREDPDGAVFAAVERIVAASASELTRLEQRGLPTDAALKTAQDKWNEVGKKKS